MEEEPPVQQYLRTDSPRLQQPKIKEVSEHPDLQEETDELKEPEDESDEEADTPQRIQDSFFGVISDSITVDPNIDLDAMELQDLLEPNTSTTSDLTPPSQIKELETLEEEVEVEEDIDELNWD